MVPVGGLSKSDSCVAVMITVVLGCGVGSMGRTSCRVLMDYTVRRARDEADTLAVPLLPSPFL